MAGVILETLSNKKLIAFVVAGFLCQFVCFLLGGLVAPAPYNVLPLLTTKCVDTYKQPHRWFEPWTWPPGRACNNVSSFKDKVVYEEKIEANMIVFSARFPMVRNSTLLDMSRWQQNIVAVLQVDIERDDKNEVPLSELSILTLDARLAYKNKDENKWTEIWSSNETRQLKCQPGFSEALEQHDNPSPVYQCELLPLFELGSCHHDYYLINLKLPVDENGTLNANLPMIEDVWVYAIHPNGGFTKVWLSMKTIMFPLVLAALIFNIYRIKTQNRSFNLLEKTLIGTGCAMTLLNLPIEYFTLWLYMPYMLLFADIRQGIFYSVLLCFWIIFAGEHLMDQVERNRLVIYWKHLSAVGAGCILLFVFEMCERGIQLHNPFFSIWATPTTANIAYTFIILAGIAACVYFFFLLYMIIMVFRNINSKKTSLPQMSKARRHFYKGLIYRFNFLMALTLLCAAGTVVFFILGQVSEGHWKWDDDRQIEYSSAVLTGVYGMWNIYVTSLLLLYAPSKKNICQTTESSEDEVIEFANIPSEASALTSLAQKSNLE